MCTLSVIPLDAGGIRVACNRDESPLRPRATPPQLETFGNRGAILPRDPQAGGTWIGVNDASLILALLNAYDPQAAAPVSKISRGMIIPSFLDANSLPEVILRAGKLDLSHFEPFRLVAMNRNEVVELAIKAGQLSVRSRSPLDRPLMFTSSGLGDALVDTPRRQLFEEFFATPGDLAAKQDAYHRHRWPGREGVSVSLLRPDALTVSQTFMEVTAAAARVTYYGAPPDEDPPAFEATLSLHPNLLGD